MRRGHAVSSSIQVADVDGDGRAELLVAGWGLEAFDPDLRRKRFAFPAGRRPFASTPAVFSRRGGTQVLVGCDDGSLYATPGLAPSGGVFARTGLDVYSSPVAASSTGEGEPDFVAFGSDDGKVWCLSMEAEPLPGFPVDCGSFVSATPCVADLDGDGRPEVMVGDWNGAFHALTLEGRELPGFPHVAGSAIWSSATAADIDGDGAQELVFATRRLHALRGDGSVAAGFPRLLGSYAVGSPVVVDLDGAGRATILLGADRLYAFDGAGNTRTGFPVTLDGFIWASPVTAESGQSGEQAAFVGTWGGGVHRISRDGGSERLRACKAPIFSTPAIIPGGQGPCVLGAASWDGRVHADVLEGWVVSERCWPSFHRTMGNVRANPARFVPPALPPAEPEAPPAGPRPAVHSAHTKPGAPRHRRAVFLRFEGEGLDQLERARVVYRVAGEDREHPTPLLLDGAGAVALVQPLGVGRRVMYHLEGRTFSGDSLRYPENESNSYAVERLGPLPVGKLVARLDRWN